MDQYLNNRKNEILWNLLAEPANNGHLYANSLQDLVNDFPQSGLLHALLSHAEGGQNIGHAATYVNPKALYKLINFPETLGEVTEAQIIQQINDNGHYAKSISDPDLLKNNETSSLNDLVEEHHHFSAEPETAVDKGTNVEHHPETENVQTAEAETHEREAVGEVHEVVGPVDTATENIYEQSPVAEHLVIEPSDKEINGVENAEGNSSDHLLVGKDETIEQTHGEIITDEVTTFNNAEAESAITTDEVVEHHPIAEETTGQLSGHNEEVNEGKEEIGEFEASADNIKKDELLTETPVFALAQPPHSIDDDVYDEIVGIDNISFNRVTKPAEETAPLEETPFIDGEEPPADASIAEQVLQKERALNMDDEAEKLIVGNIAATDYFVFDRAFNEGKPAEPIETEIFVSSNGHGNEDIKPAAKTQDVSKYNDDTMPYTFMWWLNKTRKEHAGIYQPFKLDTTQAIRQQAADELQQQYYENIFHLSSVEELDRSTSSPALEFDPKSKEDRIIKKFIIEEPHITTPSSDKLDTENKAKKSSEDQNEIVTETLARIYTEQMLYHKAINAYKKLMLKFPEKSRYFADQIEQLERKNN